MTLDDLLQALTVQRLSLRREEGDLIVLSDEEEIDSLLLSEIRLHKSALLRLIDSERMASWPPTVSIQPEMLPLMQLTADEINQIISRVPGGAANIQDIYPLAPLQEGILFHHLMGDAGDPYLSVMQLSFDSRTRLDAYLNALRAVVQRHDVLRTAVMWEGLPEPVQVVLRRVVLPVEEVELDGDEGDAPKQLYERFNPRRHRIDVREAPLLRAYIAYDKENDCWLLMETLHHLVGDHTTTEVIRAEIEAHLLGEADLLPVPLPFRNLVAKARFGVSREEHEAYFRKLLGDVEEPTVPFGLQDVQRDGTGIKEARRQVDENLAQRIRERARRLGVSAATVCHVAWAQVLVRLSGREDVVFGTVLFGRMQGGLGSDQALGLFMNTLPVRIQIGAEGAEASVLRTHRQLADLLRHEHASLAMAQRCSGVPAPTPLFTALLNYRHSAREGQEPSEQRKRLLGGIRELYAEERTTYPLVLSVDDLGEGFGLMAQVEDTIDPKRVCEYMHTALESLVEALEREPGKAVGELEVMPEEEREQVLYSWNKTDREYPSDKCVHELFEEQVSKSPESPAVVFEEASLSYGELNRQANQLAHYLREVGVKPDTRVAICVERGFEMVVGLLAVLKAGGAYVPLDPANPEERLRYMIEDSGAVMLLCQSHLLALFQDAVVPVLNVDAAPWQDCPQTDINTRSVGLNSQHLAYIIYTSGSTGKPKGVAIEHRGVSNRIVWMERAIGLGALNVVLQKTPYTFDVSVWEFFWPLIVGAQIVMARPECHKDPTYLREVIRCRGIATIHFVPSMLLAFLSSMESIGGLPLQRVVCSGEALDTRLVQKFQRQFPEVALYNLYGPTEASVDATAWTCLVGDAGKQVPIGKPISNTRVYILDARRQPVPVGVAGELYIGGAGVARGYLNQPELTAERFLEDPFVPGGRVYRTGDLGRWLPDGNIEFLGRNDFQVKVRGYRIELGEIEARLSECEGVEQALVIAREDTPGDKRLVAYYTSGSVETPGAEQLRSYLSASLPEYMVPAAYVHLKSMPLTVNGKLDRKALPAPEADAYGQHGYEAPQGEMEETLARIWAEVLKLDRIGRHDNFFELGGHSLLAVRVVMRLQQALGVELAIRAFFDHPVLSDLAGNLESGTRAELPAIAAIDRNERIPLSFAQQRLWFLAQMGEEVSQAYHISVQWHLRGRLVGSALRKALDEIVARHEALRTTFHMVEGEAVQRIVAVEDSSFHLSEHDLREDKDARAELERMVEEESRNGFDLEAGPLIRGRLIRLGEEEHALLVTMHHIVSDEWSMGVLTRELSTLYAAFVRGQASSLPKLKLQYADYAVWQRKSIGGEILEQQAAYWKKNLEGAPALLELPSDHPRPTQQDYRGSFAAVVLDAALTKGLRELSRRHGTTLYMTLLAGWAALLARLSGQQDMVVGTPVANRGRLEIESLIGFFVNTLALRLDVAGSPTVGELLKRVKNQVLTGQQHQDIPFEQVVEIVRPVRSIAHSPVFQVNFTWFGVDGRNIELPGLEVRGLNSASAVLAKLDLTLYLRDAGTTIVGDLEYATGLFERATVERYVGYFRRLLEGMVAGENELVDRLPMMPEEEREQVLYSWNKTEREYPSDKCVHELFEAQVSKSPESPAVVFEEASLSYGELNRQANRLAHYLREVGVKPDTRVAICVERGFEMVVGLLAVLKAGGAYVPLDPANPEERLRYMVEDSAPVAVLTQSSLRGLFAGIGEAVPLIELELDQRLWQHKPETDLDRAATGLTARNLAYIIYTSGSTGKPKGVMVEHAGLCNLATAQIREFSIKLSSRVLQFASFGFDASISEITMTLFKGAELHIPRATELVSGELFINMIERNKITHATLPPILMGALSDAVVAPTVLNTLIFAGDELPRSLADRWGVGRTVINAYGPTEITVCATVFCDRNLGRGRPPIGKPISNTRVYILDARRQPVPVGVAGELYIGGAGVARGYLNQPELTAERFLEDPFVPGGRVYRTGDLGRWLPDGNIEFLGRNDFQVKVRGYRIELGEIEARLSECEGVEQALVIAREDTPGDKRLVAYYTSGSVETPGAEQLRSYLSASLPEYMVPAAYVHLKSMPLTVNGKLDRKALPAPEADAYGQHGYEAPQGEMEETLAQIWAEVLKLDRIGRHDNFFELGGHSLLVITVIERMRRIGWQVDVGATFETPTLVELASSVSAERTVEVPPNLIPEGCEAITPDMLTLL